MFQFAHAYILYFLGIIPVIIALFVYSQWRKKRLLSQYGDITILQDLMPEQSKSRPVLKLVILLLAIAFFIFGLAGPQFGVKLQEVKRKGVEIIIALDVSNSMLSADIQPNRLERAKQAISKLVDRLKQDKIGLIVFAGDAMTQLPITADYASAKMFLSNINPSLVSVQGTAIGKAINLASVSFTPDGASDKAIIIISDGENFEDDALDAAKKAREKGIYLYTIGIGSPSGAPIPISTGGGQTNYLKDAQGQVVVSKLDETTLNQIAAAGEGVYIRANNAQIGLNTIFDQIKKLKKAEYESKIYSEYKDQFQYPMAIALILLIIEILILERKTKWSSRINLFDEKKVKV
jgi:Ca-activated chloride channel family protein